MHLDLLNLLLVLLAAYGGGRLAARIGYPAVLGEIVAGILLGPPLLGLLVGSPALEVLAEIGVLVMMLYIGMEIDPRELGKASLGGVLAAIGGFIVPFGAAFGVTWYFLEGQDPRMRLLGSLFVGTAAGVTSLSTKSRILVDLNLLDTRLAHVMMAGALISDTLCLIVMAGLIGTAREDFALTDLGWLGVKTVAFFLVVGLIGVYLLPLAGRWMTRLGLHNRTSLFTVVLALAISFAELAELAGLHGILGAFIAGLFIRDGVFGRRLSLELAGVVRDTSVGFLAPIFFVTAGFAVTFSPFQEDLGLLVALVGVATVGKIVGTAVFYLPSGNGWREGLVLGGAMNGRGAVEIIMAGIGLQLGLITEGLFSVLVFMAIFTTATVPVLLKLGADWLRRRGELVRIHGDRKGTLIVGAGPLALALAEILRGDGDSVTLIDTNEDRISAAKEQGFRAVAGDALLEADLGKASADTVARLLAMTSNPTVNVLAAKIASTAHDVPDAMILQIGEPSRGRDSALRLLGASTLFGQRVPLRDIDAALDGRAPNVVEVSYGSDERATWTARDRVPLAWRREGRWIPFSDRAKPDEGDRVLVAIIPLSSPSVAAG